MEQNYYLGNVKPLKTNGMKNQHQQTWTTRDVRTMKIRFNDGLTDEQIGEELGRSAESVKVKRLQYGLMRKRGPKPSSTYTLQNKRPMKRVRKPRSTKNTTSWSLLWGMIKVTRG